MIRWLADENIPRSLVTELRSRGHDVIAAQDVALGAPDRALLAVALDATRVLITFDRDFGREIFAAGGAASFGVVLVRIDPHPQSEFVRTIADVLDARDDWPHHFSVIETDRVRMTPLRPPLG